MPYTHKNTEGKTKSRVPQVFTFRLFLKWQKVKTKKPAWTSCLDKMETTSKPLQPLCWELKNQNLRGEGSWQWPEGAVCTRRWAQEAFRLEGIPDTKLKSGTPYTICRRTFDPCWRRLAKARMLCRDLLAQTSGEHWRDRFAHNPRSESRSDA